FESPPVVSARRRARRRRRDGARGSAASRSSGCPPRFGAAGAFPLRRDASAHVRGHPRSTSLKATASCSGRWRGGTEVAMGLRRIAPDVHVCLQADRGLGTSNSGLINRGGGLVVDTFWDLPHTRALIAEYATVWKAPARRVVNTHRNGDHCWGN